ncbi:hypothetical protein [Motiliproteus sp. SC1-56]|uniref:hypothetical protein n=1 Tax=Motiliproteus sp. SC1-56 TaxID=2799565 RepID=UPI001A8F575B|nr:hypothetical protein [Motiliproteus sp. SC1-56]
MNSRPLFSALCLGLALAAASVAQAAPDNRIANLCQERWPAQKGMQSYCIKVNREYHDWLQYIRKRVYRDSGLLRALEECQAEYAPDYRQVSDCYWDEAE